MSDPTRQSGLAAPDRGEAEAVLARLLAFADPVEAPAAARRLVAAFGSLSAIAGAHPRRLAALVGAAPAALLQAHRAALMLALREPAMRGPILATRYDLIDYLRHGMAFAEEEMLRVFFLNARRELLAEEVLARGGPAGVAAEPRQVIVRALELGATGLLLVHNHPSGDPEPSEADRRFTRRLATAGECLGIRLHDHLVVARDGHLSVTGEERKRVI